MDFLSTTSAAESCAVVIASAVERGDLWNARRRAVAHCLTPSEAAPPFFLGVKRPPPPPPAFDDGCGRRCAEAWSDATDALLARPDHLRLVRRAHRRHFRRLGGSEPLWAARLVECFEDRGAHHGTSAQGWEACCSSLRALDSDDCHAARSRAAACCAFGNESRAFLRIPAIREAAVQVRLPTGRLLRVEQDGWLRPFDMPTVLWPAGFLLAQHVTGACARLRRGARVLELGAGVGAPSVACALSGADVLSTDVAPTSLALTQANAALNGAALKTARFDWHSDADLARVAAAGPWDAILGAALQFERWSERFWAVLGTLASPGSVVALVHTTGALQLDEAARRRFSEVSRIAGAAYGMGLGPADALYSDFEVVVLQALADPPGPH